MKLCIFNIFTFDPCLYIQSGNLERKSTIMFLLVCYCLFTLRDIKKKIPFFHLKKYPKKTAVKKIHHQPTTTTILDNSIFYIFCCFVLFSFSCEDFIIIFFFCFVLFSFRAYIQKRFVFLFLLCSQTSKTTQKIKYLTYLYKFIFSPSIFFCVLY